MALSIKTAEADTLARSLARLTDETMTEAVTIALRQRLERERSRLDHDQTMPDRVMALSATLRAQYETASVSRAEWDAASGDEP